MTRRIPQPAILAIRLLARIAAGLFLLATAAFIVVQAMPGDPVRRVLGPGATEVDIARARTALGLDEPWLERYLSYLVDVFTFDLGTAFSGEPVLSVLGDRAAATAQLAGASIVVTAVLSVAFGLVVAAYTQNEQRTRLAGAFTVITGLLAAIPQYVLAMGLVALFAVTLTWFPVAGADGPISFVLPVAALSFPAAAVLARVVRVETLSALRSDYARTVRSKHLPARTLYLRHVLPNVLNGALTIGGVMFGYLLGGSVIVENVFQWPGLGTEMVNAIESRDYPVLQAAIIFIGIGVLIINALIDVLLHTLDPRLRVSA